MTHQHNLIYIGWNRWDTIWQRSHHLALNFSRLLRVLYVDPVAYSLPGYLYHRLKGNHSRNLRPRLRAINENLFVFSPPPLLPFSLDYEVINRVDHALLAYMVKPILRQLAMQHPILWLTYPAHVPLVGAFNEKLVCYDCMDNYPAFYHPNTARARLATSQEQRLLAGADCVTTTALSLHRRLSAQHPHVYIVRNAVGEEFLAHSGSRSTPPPDWPPGDGPVIGYMGAIAPWLDFEAVTQLAIRHPNWRIVFIGPSEIDLSSYNRLTNVHFLGPKPYDELIGYVAQFDIGLIPFVKNELTVNVNPVKIYEYFALGKPVVATSLPELWPFSQLCYLADNAAEFAQQVERAVEDLKAANPEAAARRRALAQANTWIARTAKIINILESRLAVKQTI